MANKTGGSDIFTNSVACGLLAGLTCLDLKFIDSALREVFSDKNQEIIEKNVRAAAAGYEFAKANFKSDKFALKQGKPKEDILISANEAIALGQLRQGVNFIRPILCRLQQRL